jgi:AcrR family transcriptional regulator
MNDESDSGSGAGLPASIEIAWGLRDRPRKGPKRGLSLKQIIEAGVKVALSDGLAAVSMNRVAAELGASPMSLYRYVASKDELLTLMVDAAFGPPPAIAETDEGWRTRLSRWAWAARAAYYRHPWTLRVPISGPPTTPNQVAWMEEGLAALRDTGLTETEKLSVVQLLSGFIRNEATLAANLSTAHLASGSTPQETMSTYGRLLAAVTDTTRFPALQTAIAAGAFDTPGGPDDEFVFGLERILDGIEALVRARAAGPIE